MMAGLRGVELFVHDDQPPTGKQGPGTKYKRPEQASVDPSGRWLESVMNNSDVRVPAVFAYSTHWIQTSYRETSVRFITLSSTLIKKSLVCRIRKSNISRY